MWPMSRVHMIRHGRPASTWGEADPDPGLDAAGAAQARAVAEILLALPADQRPTRVVSSPLRRCRETAQPLADALGVPVEIDPRVGEIPTPAGLAADDRPAWLRQAFQGRWADIAGDLDYAAWTREVARGVISHPGAAVFSHFVALNAAVSAATGGEAVAAFRPDHVSVTVFEIVDGGLILVEKGREASTQVL
jgi:broad specificity phosphatase PhoE